jgi:hypothetical protein
MAYKEHMPCSLTKATRDLARYKLPVDLMDVQ